MANPKLISEIHTPAILIESAALERNIGGLQGICDAAGVELWPHCKTHKLVPVLKRQLAAGAKGATCAKLSEAEALLPSGVRRVFIAHSLAQGLIGPRLKQLAGKLDELILAVTSAAYAEVLESLLAHEGLKLPVLMAVDTGLDREGVRTPEDAKALADRITKSPHMEFRGIYTHDGHAYMQARDGKSLDEVSNAVIAKMESYAEAIGGEVLLWPGCSVTASRIAATGRVHAVRPGAYVFGDLYLSQVIPVMKREDVAVSVLTSVLDHPRKELAFIDAGSKTFSSDRTPDGNFAEVNGHPGLHVTKLSEEHGFLTGEKVAGLRIGDRLRCTPAHICPVMNLASKVYLVDGEKILDVWPVDARGCNY